MNTSIALCSVVTRSVLPEFRLLKYSFELYHGAGRRWFLRTDRATADALAGHPRISCTVFTDEILQRPDIECADFRTIVGQKMNALADAWDSGCGSVLFMDADLLITAPILGLLQSIPGQVLLAPNYYPKGHEHFIPIHGYYNAGLAFTRTNEFHVWWKNAFAAEPTRWTDQAVLNEAWRYFEIGTIPNSANIGFWRSANGLQHPAIPADCSCLHAHFFQPLRTVRQWIDRAFALHCVEYLNGSHDTRHGKLLRKILATDAPGWYQAAMRIR